MSLMELRLARAARLVREAADDERGEVVPQALLDGLNEVVPGLCVCFNELEPRSRRVISFQSSAPALPDNNTDPDWDTAWWEVYPQFRALRYGQDLTRQDVVKLSDSTSDRMLVNTRLFQEYLLPDGERYEMFVPLPAMPGRTRNFVFCRWDSDFTEADRDLLTLLRPHLQAVHDVHQRRRAGSPQLTARQWQVLRCLAQGQSTEQVAAAMCVSTSTVRKHLENIYERLGVTSRAAAVGLAFANPERSPPAVVK